MARRKKIYEGKAKILYEGPKPGTVVQYFKDDVTAHNAKKKAVVEGKGVLNNMLSEHFMIGLSGIGIPTHFMKRLNMREQLVQSAEVIPLEVVVRNFAAGSLCRRLGLEEGSPFSRPVMEYYLKDDALGDPMVTEEHIAAIGWVSSPEFDDIIALTLRVNDFLSGILFGVGIRLVDFKLEFGRVYEDDYKRVILVDEISPDTCRLWDSDTNEKLDKDVFREDLGDLSKAYSEVASRLGVMPRGPSGGGQPSVVTNLFGPDGSRPGSSRKGRS